MYVETHIGMPLNVTDVVWSWFQAMPAKIRKFMLREKQTPKSFRESFENDLVYLVYDGDLLGCVVAEKKAEGIYEIHLFCPRHTSTAKLAEAIHNFFKVVNADERITKLWFPVRKMQSRLGACIIEEGCSMTGWSVHERGQSFYLVVYEKELIVEN